MARVIPDDSSVIDDLSPARYPWDEWLDGQIWQIVAGEDYECSTESMRVQVYGAAKRLGTKATTRVTSNPEGLLIQAKAAQ